MRKHIDLIFASLLWSVCLYLAWCQNYPPIAPASGTLSPPIGAFRLPNGSL